MIFSKTGFCQSLTKVTNQISKYEKMPEAQLCASIPLYVQNFLYFTKNIFDPKKCK